jgi:hypothetical protein
MRSVLRVRCQAETRTKGAGFPFNRDRDVGAHHRLRADTFIRWRGSWILDAE